MQNHLIILYLPLVISNVLHMFVVKYNLIVFLKKPISTSFFGENKTYRGFTFVSIINAATLFLCSKLFNIELNHSPLILGFLLGLGYVFFELPNSYIKRKLGIAPGETSEKHKFLFIILDRCDSAFGVSLIYTLFTGLGFKEFLFLFILAFLVHFFFSYLLFKVGIKEKL